jgi:hypothetical protein
MNPSGNIINPLTTKDTKNFTKDTEDEIIIILCALRVFFVTSVF